MTNRLCKIDGCTVSHRAKGYCSTHYKQVFGRSVHTIIKSCVVCGTSVTRETRQERYANTYCSELCRQWNQYGAWSSKLPATHWARMYGATCKVTLKHDITCEWCGTETSTTRSIQRYCTRDCKVKHSKATRRGRQYNAIGTYSWADITRLWLLFNRCCAYCTKPTALTDIQAEHVIALSCGGANNTSNLLPSCGPCNADKRDLTLEAWAVDRARRGLPPVVTTWTYSDARYKHLAERTSVRMSA